MAEACAGNTGDLHSRGFNVENIPTTCNLTLGSDLPNTFAALVPLAHNGGPTRTHLAAGSLAVDGGEDAACPAIDQRRVGRPIDGDTVVGARCDIGAVEHPACQPLLLEEHIVDSSEQYIGCSTITVGPDVTVQNPGDLYLHAGDAVVFGNGFEVGNGAPLIVEIGFPTG